MIPSFFASKAEYENLVGTIKRFSLALGLMVNMEKSATAKPIWIIAGIIS